jgi:hypothetical protein
MANLAIGRWLLVFAGGCLAEKVDSAWLHFAIH